jgi:hypothetical protein
LVLVADVVLGVRVVVPADVLALGRNPAEQPEVEALRAGTAAATALAVATGAATTTTTAGTAVAATAAAAREPGCQCGPESSQIPSPVESTRRTSVSPGTLLHT